ncbi:MAG: hypothetical protein QXO96_08510, partial [Sulfolobales archaeon]
WNSFRLGIQHENSLNCYKVGIPISGLKIPLEEFLSKFSYISGKYSIFPFPLSLFSKGVIVFYLESEKEMREFIEKVKEYVKDDPSFREKFFYNKFVNVEWIGGINWRRGCPEYDKKFGDWRRWEKRDK